MENLRTCFLVLITLAIGAACSSTRASRTGVRWETLSGTVSFDETVALPYGASVDVKLVDVSLAEAGSRTIAQQHIQPSARAPIPFELRYDPATIDSARRYVLQARITLDGRIVWTNIESIPVFTTATPRKIEIVVKRIP